jgi:hypothetical protein
MDVDSNINGLPLQGGFLTVYSLNLNCKTSVKKPLSHQEWEMTKLKN